MRFLLQTIQAILLFAIVRESSCESSTSAKRFKRKNAVKGESRTNDHTFLRERGLQKKNKGPKAVEEEARTEQKAQKTKAAKQQKEIARASGIFMPAIQEDENYNACYGYALANEIRTCLADIPLLDMKDCSDYNQFLSEQGESYCGPDITVAKCIENYCAIVCPTSDFDYEEQESACRLTIYSCCTE
jgi:hypothetical protein